MELIANQHFENETIGFDGFQFVECTFTDCLIIITSLDFGFDRCSFYNTSFHVLPDLPVFDIAQRLYGTEAVCGDSAGGFWTDVYKGTGKVLELPLGRK